MVHSIMLRGLLAKEGSRLKFGYSEGDKQNNTWTKDKGSKFSHQELSTLLPIALDSKHDTYTGKQTHK